MNLLENGRQFFYSFITSPANKYHGLLNQGATCYLNSVLQVLFMTKEFRQAVKRHTCENPNTDCIDRHLTTLFDDLEGQTAYTYNITKNLGIDRVHEQRDAAEYFEKILNLTSPEASQIFHGELRHENKCVCGAETNTDNPFWHLPLALMDSSSENYSVVDGIEKFFSSSEVSGENQMYCDKCDDKADATLVSVIKHHPDVLMLLLKRFEFDYRYMAYVKINCVVDVPLILQIPENQTYELYAVVNHSGDLRSGHYTATIKSDDDGRWYNFNDARVSMPFQVDNNPKSQSAYLLFYMKKKVDAAETCTQDIKQMFTPEGLPMDISDNDKQLQDAVKIKKKHEGGEEAEVSNDTAEAVSTYRYEGKENRDMDNFESRGVEMMRDDVEGMGRNTGADGQAERRDVLSVKTHTDENVDDQNNDSEGLDFVTQKRPCKDLAGDEQSEDQDNERLDDVRHENQERKQKSGQDYGLECVGVVKQGDEEVIKMKVNKDKRQQEINNTLGQVHSRQVYVDKQGEEKRDGKGDKKQKRGDDKHIQSRGTSVRYCGEGVEDQNFRRLDDDKQNRRQEQQDQKSRFEDDSVERLTREEEHKKEYNEHIQNREDQGKSEGSERLTENQRSCDQYKRQGDTQPDVRSGSHSVTENMTEGREHPKEEKVKRTDSDGQSRTSRDKTMKTEMVDETSRGSKKSRKFERKGDSKTDTLTQSVHSLSLNESPEPEKYKTKEVVRERKWWQLKRPLKSEDREGKKKRKKTNECVMCITFGKGDQMTN